MEQHRAVPTSRLGRLLHLGRLGSGIAGGAIGEGLRQLGAGRRPSAADLLLTPANAHRLAERLSEMRGAAMKLGQLLSMEAGDLTTTTVLAMDLLEGAPIESLASAPRPLRDRTATRLVDLALRELFDWGLVQTDPNFANFRYRAECDEIVLLDFGAVRRYEPERMTALRGLLTAALAGDDTVIQEAAVAVGYLRADDPRPMRDGVLGLIKTAAEPARKPDPFDFSTGDLSERLSEQVLSLRLEQGFGRLPPPDVLYLHRKLGGLYLLCKRLRARVPVSELTRRWSDSCGLDSLDPAVGAASH